MKIKYACLNPIASCGLANLTSDYERTEDPAEADAIFVRSAKMEELAVSPRWLAVARAGAGVNNIPHADYAKKGIVVFNTPGANANGVKELVIAAMLLASRDLIGGVKWVEANASDPLIAKSAEKAKKAFAGTEIAGKRLGVVGLGAIGRKVANAALALGLEVLGYDPLLSSVAAKELDGAVKRTADLDEIYRSCDIITIHVPALDSTKGMVSATAFEKMKDGVIIINAARDVLVNEDDLLVAIEKGKVRTYVSDFPNATTAGRPGCIVIPHLGASTEESEDNCAVMAAKEIRDFIENGNIINSVNYPACTLGSKPKSGRLAVCYLASEGLAEMVASVLGRAGIKVVAQASATRGAVGYALIDADAAIPQEVIEQVKAIDSVVRVRQIG